MNKVIMVKEKMSDKILMGAMKASGMLDKGKALLVEPFNNSLASIDESGNNAGKIVFMILGITIGLGVVAAVVVGLKAQVTAFIAKLGTAASTAY